SEQSPFWGPTCIRRAGTVLIPFPSVLVPFQHVIQEILAELQLEIDRMVHEAFLWSQSSSFRSQSRPNSCHNSFDHCERTLVKSQLNRLLNGSILRHVVFSNCFRQLVGSASNVQIIGPYG